MGIDNFSVRWTGRHSFPAGDHTFTASADDGIRVWLDSAPVIDAWIDQSPTTYQSTRPVTAGDHEVKVEYYENGGGALAKVSWAAATANTPPTPTIAAPSAATTWKVGDTFNFSGAATDTQDGTLPESALSWSVVLQHCPSTCHEHPIQTLQRGGERFVRGAGP